MEALVGILILMYTLRLLMLIERLDCVEFWTMIGPMTSAEGTVPRTIKSPTATVTHRMISPCHGSKSIYNSLLISITKPRYDSPLIVAYILL